MISNSLHAGPTVPPSQIKPTDAQIGGMLAGKAPVGMPIKVTEAASAPKRSLKKRKLPDRHVPEKIAHIVPESTLFLSLLEYQRRMDDLLARKKSDIREALNQPEHVPKKLRLYVYNTHANQQGPAGGGGQAPREPPAWALCIHGRLLDPVAAVGAASTSTSAPSTPHAGGGRHSGPLLTQCIRRLEVKLSGSSGGSSSSAGGETLVWDKAQHQGPQKEMFEIRRSGNSPTEVQISLHMDWQPARYALPDALARLLGLQYESRARVMHMLWSYIKARKLQDPHQPHIVNLDPALVEVFGEPTLKLGLVSERLAALLLPMPPINIKYSIRLDGPSPAAHDIYDFDYELPSFSHGDRLPPFLDSASRDRELEGVDARLGSLLRRLNEHRRRRAFFLGFAQSPVDFIHALLASQAKDLRMAKNSTGRDYEVERRSDLFRQKWVEDAATRYLQKKISAGH